MAPYLLLLFKLALPGNKQAQGAPLGGGDTERAGIERECKLV